MYYTTYVVVKGSEKIIFRVARETKTNKGAAICGMMKAAKQNHQTTREDAVRNYITQHVPGTHITFEQRQRKVVQLSEPNRKGELSRWRKEALKKKDRDRKRKGRRRKARPLSNHNF